MRKVLDLSKVILTYGTFDLFHIGHVHILERAKALGDRLVVGVSTDEFNFSKGKKSMFPYEHRSKIVQSLSCVDLVIPERDWDQKISDVKKYSVDTFVMGHDWTGKFDFLLDYCDVCYLPRTDGISTTEIKSALSAFKSEKIEELRKGIDTIQSLMSQLD